MLDASLNPVALVLSGRTSRSSQRRMIGFARCRRPMRLPKQPPAPTRQLDQAAGSLPGQSRGPVCLGRVVPAALSAAANSSARVVVFTGDHELARSGCRRKSQMVASIDAGGAAINALADVAGATVPGSRTWPWTDPLSERIGAHKVRRGSSNIAPRTLTNDETTAAITAGQQIADEVDAGAIAHPAGDMESEAAAAVSCGSGRCQAVAVVGFGTGIGSWARKTAAVRDATGCWYPTVGLLRCAGGADCNRDSWLPAQAAVRRTRCCLTGWR